VVDGSRLDVHVADGMDLTLIVDQSSPETFVLLTGWPAPSALTGPDAPVSLTDLAGVAAMARSGLLECRAHEDRVGLRMTVYRDGLSRHSFLDAVGEVGRAYQFLEKSAADFEAQAAGQQRDAGAVLQNR
jgi:hypothetical protein